MPSLSSTIPVCIPARWAARRFPGKLLSPWGGKTVLEAVIATAQESAIGPVIVLAADNRIQDALAKTDVQVERVAGDFLNGSERIAAALRGGQLGRPVPQLVVNLQGDAVGATPALLRSTVETLRAHPAATLATTATWSAESSPSGRTTVRASGGLAVDFSRRALDPGIAGAGDVREQRWLLHVGLYAYRTQDLLTLANQAPGARELEESLEQLRWIENNRSVALHIEAGPSSLAHAIDSPEDLGQSQSLSEPSNPPVRRRSSDQSRR